MYDMKRLSDRDTHPKGKRSRSCYDEDMRDRLSPDMDRRIKRSNSMGRDPKNHRDRDYDSEPDRYQKRNKHVRGFSDPYKQMPPRQERPNQAEYKTLCINQLNPQVPDDVVRDTLYEDFKRFGTLNVKVVRQSPDHRVAFLNFRYYDDAFEAKHAHKQMMLFDRVVRLDPVYHNQRRQRIERESRESPEYDDRGDFRGPNNSPGRPRIMQQSGNMYRGDRNQFNDVEEKWREHRFPHHLQHIRPEDDDKATRTLFAGNLDYNITDQELRDVFERYGIVEDIDIKRPTKGQGNAYAFVKFRNLDMAHRAKVSFSGQYIGNLQCKIGYGKVNPTNCLWVGGLGPWVKIETLEREFDRFGAIRRLEWPPGKNYAYVLYDSIDAAQAACQDMRGVPLGSPENRIRVDFADPKHIGAGSPARSQSDDFDQFNPPPPFERDQESLDDHFHGNKGFRDRPWPEQRDNWPDEQDVGDSFRNPDDPSDFDGERTRRSYSDRRSDMAERPKRPRSPVEEIGFRRRSRTPMDNQRDFSPVSGRDRDPERQFSDSGIQSPKQKRRRSSPDSHTNMNVSDSGKSSVDGVSNRKINEKTKVAELTSVSDFSKCMPPVWKGEMVLKSSAFPCCFYHIGGDMSLADSLMGSGESSQTLRITQRLRLDQPKLDEVGRRVSTSGTGGHTILLALPAQTAEESSGGLQQRPLKNLVSYLKQKEAAGIIPLPLNGGKDKEDGGVLHAFPPCSFGQEYLQQRAPMLGSEPSKEDHLVVIIVKGAP